MFYFFLPLTSKGLELNNKVNKKNFKCTGCGEKSLKHISPSYKINHINSFCIMTNLYLIALFPKLKSIFTRRLDLWEIYNLW